MKNTRSFYKKNMLCSRSAVRAWSIEIFFLLAMCLPLMAQNDVEYVPDSSEIRESLIETWFIQDIAVVLEQDTQIVQNRLGDYFLVRAEERGAEVAIIVAPLVRQLVKMQTMEILVDDAETEMENTVQEEGTLEGVAVIEDKAITSIETWPENGQGSWVLYRDAQTGNSLRVRYYFMPDPQVYVQFFKGFEKSFGEFSIFGALVASRVPVAVLLEYFYTASFEDVQYITRHTLPWNYANVYEQVYDDTMQMVGVIRSLLPVFRQAGMFVSTTGQFDFLKWIVDGLIKPITGGILFDEPLRQNTLNSSVNAIPASDAYKSFDYIRNLAAAAISARTSVSYHYNTSGADVKTEPFSLYTDADGVLQRAGFILNSGYVIDMLKPLLYVLAVTEPGRFFLGAIRENIPSTAGGKIPEQQMYNRAVAFFPWFDSEGHLQIAVFEDGSEFTYNQFLERYPNSFVHLVRIKASMEFYPDEPPESENAENIVDSIVIE